LETRKGRGEKEGRQRKPSRLTEAAWRASGLQALLGNAAASRSARAVLILTPSLLTPPSLFYRIENHPWALNRGIPSQYPLTSQAAHSRTVEHRAPAGRPLLRSSSPSLPCFCGSCTTSTHTSSKTTPPSRGEGYKPRVAHRREMPTSDPKLGRGRPGAESEASGIKECEGRPP
jgi:hypothetical protein